MKIFLSREELNTLKKNKKKIEKEEKVKISILSDGVDIEGRAIDEYMIEKIIKAIALGFDLKTAFLLKEEDYMLEEINIKDYVRPSRVKDAKSRVIGSEGRAIKNLCNLSNCAIKLHGNIVAIIGLTEDVKDAEQSIISLIKGSKHSNVYSRLEKLKSKLKSEDLGLK